MTKIIKIKSHQDENRNVSKDMVSLGGCSNLKKCQKLAGDKGIILDLSKLNDEEDPWYGVYKPESEFKFKKSKNIGIQYLPACDSSYDQLDVNPGVYYIKVITVKLVPIMFVVSPSEETIQSVFKSIALPIGLRYDNYYYRIYARSHHKEYKVKP